MSNSLIPSFIYIFSLGMSVLWLANKLGWLSYLLKSLQKTNNKSNILIPSFFVLFFPFLAAKAAAFLEPQLTNIFSLLLTNIFSSQSPLFSNPILLFIGGQIIEYVRNMRENEKKEKEQVKEDIKKEKEQVNLLILKMETVINYLSHIEGLLISSVRDIDVNSDNSNIYEKAKEYKLEIDNLYDNLCSQIEYSRSNNALAILLYINRIKNYLELLFSKENPHPQDKLSELSTLRDLKVQCVENIINLKQKPSQDIGEVKYYIEYLKEYRKDFVWYKNDIQTNNKYKERYGYYGKDTELAAEERIKDIFRRLEIPIERIEDNNNVSDFETFND